MLREPSDAQQCLYFELVFQHAGQLVPDVMPMFYCL